VRVFWTAEISVQTFALWMASHTAEAASHVVNLLSHATSGNFATSAAISSRNTYAVSLSVGFGDHSEELAWPLLGDFESAAHDARDAAAREDGSFRGDFFGKTAVSAAALAGISAFREGCFLAVPWTRSPGSRCCHENVTPIAESDGKNAASNNLP
jgi:hypothetical protein